MNMLTEQDINFLDSIAGKLDTAMKFNYARGLQSHQIEYLRMLYKKMYGTDYVGSASCSTCQLRLLQQVGKWLQKHKEVHEELEPVLTVNELGEQVTNKSKKKRKK